VGDLLLFDASRFSELGFLDLSRFAVGDLLDLDALPRADLDFDFDFDLPRFGDEDLLLAAALLADSDFSLFADSDFCAEASRDLEEAGLFDGESEGARFLAAASFAFRASSALRASSAFRRASSLAF